MKLGVSRVINDNNGKDRGNKEFNWVYVRDKASLNESRGEEGTSPET